MVGEEKIGYNVACYVNNIINLSLIVTKLVKVNRLLVSQSTFSLLFEKQSRNILESSILTLHHIMMYLQYFLNHATKVS